MKPQSIIRILGVLSFTGSIGLLIWWFLFPAFLPVSDAADNFQNMILDNNWIAMNLIGLISALLLCMGFPGFYLRYHQKLNVSGFIGLILACTGLILFICIQYYETIIWPAAARIYPELVQTRGALVSGNSTVVAGLIVSGVILGAGYILFCISALRKKVFPKIPVWFLLVGAPVFGNGIVFPVRTIGLLLFSAGTIWLVLNITNK